MKRFILLTIAALVIVATLGCQSRNTSQHTSSISPSQTTEPEQSFEDYPPEPTTAPLTIAYKSKSMGIQFSLPEDWKGRYRITERRNKINVYFVPKLPYEKEYMDCWLFLIEKKTADNEEDENFLDGYTEVTIKGVTYICGGSTDIRYEGLEDEIYIDMVSDMDDIFASLRAL